MCCLLYWKDIHLEFQPLVFLSNVFFFCNNAELAAPFELLNALLQLDETSCNLENSFLSKGVDECVGSLPDEDEALSTKGPTLLPELEGLKLSCCSPCIFETPAIEFL